ncbi:UQCC2 factor, partial [Polypterus senegalus]
MAATRYRRFLRLCEEWPRDASKQDRDLGTFMRQRIAVAFREGENTQIADPEKCDQMYESLARINSNFYKSKRNRQGCLCHRQGRHSGLLVRLKSALASSPGPLAGHFSGRYLLYRHLEPCYNSLPPVPTEEESMPVQCFSPQVWSIRVNHHDL